MQYVPKKEGKKSAIEMSIFLRFEQSHKSCLWKFFSQLEDGPNWHQLRPENAIKVQQENSCHIHTIKAKSLTVKVDEL